MVLKSINAIQPQEAQEMDDITHIINGMDIEGVLNGGDLGVVIDGRFTGEIHAEHITIGEHGLFLENFLPRMWKSEDSLMVNCFATH